MTRPSHSFCIVTIAFWLLALIGTNQIADAQSKFVTVSLRSVANNRFDWIPINETGRRILGGVPFDLLSASGKNVWDSRVGTMPGEHSTQTLELPVRIFGATKAYSLINTLWGSDGSESVSLSFVCSDDTKYTVTLRSGDNIRDWVISSAYVPTINERTTQSMAPEWKNGLIDRQQILLPKAFEERTLTRIVLTDSGVTGNDDFNFCKRVHAQRAFLLGLTIETRTDIPGQSALANLTHDNPPSDELAQKLLDEALSKLKGAQAKQATDLRRKYIRDSEKLAQQRTETDEEMQREVLKILLLPRNIPSKRTDADLANLKVIDEAIATAGKLPDSKQAIAQCKREILAIIDKGNVWSEDTKARQFEIICSVSSEKRTDLLHIYHKYEPKFSAQAQQEFALEEQYKKDLLKVIAPDVSNDK